MRCRLLARADWKRMKAMPPDGTYAVELECASCVFWTACVVARSPRRLRRYLSLVIEMLERRIA
jgi:hypothetical protein